MTEVLDNKPEQVFPTYLQACWRFKAIFYPIVDIAKRFEFIILLRFNQINLQQNVTCISQTLSHSLRELISVLNLSELEAQQYFNLIPF